MTQLSRDTGTRPTLIRAEVDAGEILRQARREARLALSLQVVVIGVFVVAIVGVLAIVLVLYNWR